MTDCRNAERRDQLPDLVHGTLSAAEATAVQAHLTDCAECTQEVALIRMALAIRPRTVGPDVAGIVRQLPRPGLPRRTIAADADIVPVGGRDRSRWRAQRAWRLAAGVGLLLASGWSIQLVRRGSVALLAPEASDSVPLAAAAESIRAIPATSVPPVATAGTVAIGSMSEYTDEELERLLERVDRWDGTTSAEVSTMATPILPVHAGGTNR